LFRGATFANAIAQSSATDAQAQQGTVVPLRLNWI